MEEAGCPAGTTIVVRDLFYNTPARMKFLKKDAAEGNSVAGVLDKMALSHPEISFRFIREGKEVLHTPGDNKLSSAIYAVFGKEFSSTLIPVEYELEHVKVSGFISKPAGSRPNRSMQHFFLNGRSSGAAPPWPPWRRPTRAPSWWGSSPPACCTCASPAPRWT